MTIHAQADDAAPPADSPARTALLRAVLTAALTDQEAPDELTFGVQDGPEGPTLSLVTIPGDSHRAAALRTASDGHAAHTWTTPPT